LKLHQLGLQPEDLGFVDLVGDLRPFLVLPRHGPTLVPVRSERTEKSFGECQWPVIALSDLIASVYRALAVAMSLAAIVSLIFRCGKGAASAVRDRS
jgi:hypothetical protein